MLVVAAVLAVVATGALVMVLRTPGAIGWLSRRGDAPGATPLDQPAGAPPIAVPPDPAPSAAPEPAPAATMVVAAEPPQAPTPAAVPTMVAPPPPTAASPGRPFPRGSYTVQAGAYDDRVNADQLAVELRGKGFDVWVLEVGSGKARFKVRVGAAAKRSEAETIARELKERAGISGWITH